MLLTAMLSVSVSADIVFLKNGDRISGVVNSVDPDRVKIKPSYSGEIELDMEGIKSLQTDATFTLQLEGEQETEYQFKGDDGEGRVLLKSAEKEIAVALTDLKKIEPVKPRFVWGAKIDFSQAFSRGNTNSQISNLNAMVDATLEDHRFIFDLSSLHEKKEGETIKQGDRLNASYNHLYANSWFFALNATVERDPVAKIDQRISLNPSIGYDIWNETSRKLNVQLGVGYQKEQINDDRDASTLIDWRLRYEQEIFDSNLGLFHNHQIYRNLAGRENLVFNSVTGVRLAITTDFYLNVQLKYDIDSAPVAGTDNEDLTFLFGVGVAF